jgi:hypothetical protein
LSASEPFISVNSSATIQAVCDEEALALFYASRGDRQQALQFAEKAVAHAEHYAAGPATELRKSHLARSYFVLASVHSKFADRAEARRWANAAVDLWRPVQSRAILALHRKAINEATALAQPPRY